MLYGFRGCFVCQMFVREEVTGRGEVMVVWYYAGKYLKVTHV